MVTVTPASSTAPAATEQFRRLENLGKVRILLNKGPPLPRAALGAGKAGLFHAGIHIHSLAALSLSSCIRLRAVPFLAACPAVENWKAGLEPPPGPTPASSTGASPGSSSALPPASSFQLEADPDTDLWLAARPRFSFLQAAKPASRQPSAPGRRLCQESNRFSRPLDSGLHEAGCQVLATAGLSFACRGGRLLLNSVALQVGVVGVFFLLSKCPEPPLHPRADRLRVPSSL